jgi:hypothetical protein
MLEEAALAHRVSGVVDRAAQGEPDPAGSQRVADRPGIWDRASQSVKLGHDQRVTLTRRGQGAVEPGARAVAAGQAVTEIDPVLRDAELLQDLALRGEVLPFSGTAGVANQDP